MRDQGIDIFSTYVLSPAGRLNFTYTVRHNWDSPFFPADAATPSWVSCQAFPPTDA